MASYIISGVASLNNRLRMPSRKAVELQAAAAADLGAIGLVVHGDHLGDGGDDAEFANWRKLFERQADKGRFAVRSSSRTPPVATTPWPTGVDRAAVGRRRRLRPGGLLPRHLPRMGRRRGSWASWAVRDITGRIDLVHLNNSRDEFDSGRDRHNLTDGHIGSEVLVVARAAAAPVIPRDARRGHWPMT